MPKYTNCKKMKPTIMNRRERSTRSIATISKRVADCDNDSLSSVFRNRQRPIDDSKHQTVNKNFLHQTPSEMRPKLYMSEVCPSARAVVLTAKLLELTLELKEVPIDSNRVATLEDSGYVIWDSHAIIAFLVGKYGKDDSLYPSRDLLKRAVIDQRLRFDSGVVSFFSKTIMNPIMYEDNANTITEIYEVVETFFDDNNPWIAGDDLTIADLTLIPSITSLDVVVPIDPIKFPKLSRWIKRAESMPFYEPNKRGLCKLKDLLNRC